MTQILLIQCFKMCSDYRWVSYRLSTISSHKIMWANIVYSGLLVYYKSIMMFKRYQHNSSKIGRYEHTTPSNGRSQTLSQKNVCYNKGTDIHIFKYRAWYLHMVPDHHLFWIRDNVERSSCPNVLFHVCTRFDLCFPQNRTWFLFTHTFQIYVN